MNERGIFPKVISAPMKSTATNDSFQQLEKVSSEKASSGES
jgi:hypothetical protein